MKKSPHEKVEDETRSTTLSMSPSRMKLQKKLFGMKKSMTLFESPPSKAVQESQLFSSPPPPPVPPTTKNFLSPFNINTYRNKQSDRRSDHNIRQRADVEASNDDINLKFPTLNERTMSIESSSNESEDYEIQRILEGPKKLKLNPRFSAGNPFNDVGSLKK